MTCSLWIKTANDLQRKRNKVFTKILYIRLKSPTHALTCLKSPPHALTCLKSLTHALTCLKSPPHVLTCLKSPPHVLTCLEIKRIGRRSDLR